MGGRTLWAGGSGDVWFPQRSYVGVSLTVLAVFLLLLSAIRQCSFREYAVTQSKSRKCKMVRTLAVLNGKFLLDNFANGEEEKCILNCTGTRTKRAEGVYEGR